MERAIMGFEAWSKANERDLARYVDPERVQLRLGVNRYDLARQPDGIRRIVEAIYDGLLGAHIRYAPEKYFPDQNLQQIRSPEEILEKVGERTCRPGVAVLRYVPGKRTSADGDRYRRPRVGSCVTHPIAWRLGRLRSAPEIRPRRTQQGEQEGIDQPYRQQKLYRRRMHRLCAEQRFAGWTARTGWQKRWCTGLRPSGRRRACAIV